MRINKIYTTLVMSTLKNLMFTSIHGPSGLSSRTYVGSDQDSNAAKFH